MNLINFKPVQNLRKFSQKLLNALLPSLAFNYNNYAVIHISNEMIKVSENKFLKLRSLPVKKNNTMDELTTKI
uniref:Uncharacterized protein n=1 Tax=Schistosoma haematobium TaxID=6185 RepID=A0A095A5J6_SCHHA